MSRGLGRIQRAISDLLDRTDGAQGLTIRDMALLIYGAAEKRHTVAVHRAANSLFRRRHDLAARMQPRRWILWRPSDVERSP
jgi:hypothetical protein